MLFIFVSWLFSMSSILLFDDASHGILGKSDKRYYLKVHVGKQKIWNDSGVVSVAYLTFLHVPS